MGLWDWFWIGAMWNEIEAVREEIEQQRIAEVAEDVEPVLEDVLPEGGSLVKLPIERDTQTEQQLHVALAGMTAEYDDEFQPLVIVRGELASTETQPARDLRILGTAYNEENEVVGTSRYELLSSDVLGPEPFQIELSCSASHGEPTLVRVLVRPS